MIRIANVLATLLVASSLAAPVLAAGDQPPRQTRHPDGPQFVPPEARYTFASYAGLRTLRIDSQLFDNNEVDFGITDEDFNSGRVGFELAFAVLPMVEVLVGFDTGETHANGTYINDSAYETRSEIEHSASLAMTEYSLGARIRPMRGARLSPYLVLGVSGTSYEYREFEAGSFLDENTYGERLFLRGLFAGGGLDFAVVRLPSGRWLDVFGEFRYTSSQGVHSDPASSLGDLRLDRAGALFGLRFRF